jgi:hypothetical protein
LSKPSSESQPGGADTTPGVRGNPFTKRGSLKLIWIGIKATIGNFNFFAQYQQCPIPLEGEIIKWEWFRFYDEMPLRESGDTIVQSWDIASKAEELSDFRSAPPGTSKVMTTTSLTSRDTSSTTLA